MRRRGRSARRRLLTLWAALLTLPSVSAQAAPAPAPTGRPQVSIAAVSGERGHAFVFAQVTDWLGSHPAPPGSSPTPYYSRWEAIPIGASGCPWVWAVFVYDRTTNRLLNPTPAVLPVPYFPTTTFFCPSPTVSPVAGPRLAIAQARLDLDLVTAVRPAAPAAGAPATISARLTSAVSDDLSLLLSMAIDEWRIDSWTVAFGDGQAATLPGGRDPTITVAHAYASSIAYQARIVASVSGIAQAAEYGPAGSPFLIRRAFTVQVGNALRVPVSGRRATRYVPPIIAAAVSPAIDGLGGVPSSEGLRWIEAPRAALVDAYLRPQIVREGYRTVGGQFAGWARSTVVGWRYAGSPGRPPDRVLPDGRWLDPNVPLRLRWDVPDVLAGTVPQDYVVDLLLAVVVRYPDGKTAELSVPAAFNVSVRYPAQNQ